MDYVAFRKIEYGKEYKYLFKQYGYYLATL